MKTTHQKQIKTFLKKESEKIYLPFLKTFSKNGKVAQVFQKMMDILPTLKMAKEKIEKPENNLLSPIPVNTKPRVMTPMTMKSSQTVVNLPQVDKEKLVSMVKNKQILNKLESPTKNQYVLTLPAYEDGKNVDAWKENIINVTSEEHAKRLEQESGNNAIKDTGRNLEIAKADALVAASKGNNTSTSNSPVVDRPTLNSPVADTPTSKSSDKLSPVTTPVSQIKAKLEPTAKTAGGSEGAKITVVGDKDKEASLVGEKGVEAIGKTEVLPKKEIDDVASTAANTQENAAEPEEAGSGAKRGGEVLKDIATTAMSFIPGLGAAAGVMKGLKGLGAVGKMAGMAKGMGGGSPLSAMSSGGGGGMGGMLGAAGGGGGGMGGMLGAAGGGGGGMGGMLGAAGGGGGGMLGAATKGGGLGGVLGSVGGGLGGLAGAAAMATPMGMALAAAPAIGAAAGGIASGVGAAAGGLAAGIGSAVGSIGGALIGGIFGNGNKETKQPVVVSSNSAAPTNITNITHQYDVYRKTAEDSFMLPNWRREYG
jgi:hypothetical protein